MSSRPRPTIERASAGDRAFLAMDTGPVPVQFGVVLMLDDAGGLDLDRVRELLAERVRSVPRLRQRLVRVPVGCGGPVWVDDPAFDIARHVRAVDRGARGDEQALLDAALAEVMMPLDRDAPLWRAVFITGSPAGGPAGQPAAQAVLVVVLHHVLSDGVGGLAVLAGLVDSPATGHGQGPETGTPVSSSFPRPRPSARLLVRDSVTRKLAGLAGARRSWHLLRRSMEAGGGMRPPRVADCSLLRPTGARRGLFVVHAELAPLRQAAHRLGGSVNDALLVAVAGALHRVLRGRGEQVDSLVLAIPVSGRGTAADPALGNVVTPALVEVPGTGTVGDRIRRVTEEMRTRRETATGPAPIASLGWVFRPLARLGGYRWYLNHQRRLHALVSHVRGPAEPLTFGGARIAAAVPVAVAESGNVTVSFVALSYAGRVTISVVADPDLVRDVDVLTGALRAEIDAVCSAAQGS